jgi:uncharacterized membrane protein
VLVDFGSMFAYVLVLVSVFFMTGVVVLFTLLHWALRARARRAERASGVVTTAVTRTSPVAPAQRTVPEVRSNPSWTPASVRATFAGAPRPAARRT